MPTLTGKASLGIGITIQNVFLGSQYEFAPFDGTIEIGMKADRANVTCAIFSGPDVLQEPGGQVPFVGGGGAVQGSPIYPDDFLWEDEVAKGDRIKLTLVNADPAAAVVNWSLRMTPA